MLMESLAYASIDRLALESLRLEKCKTAEAHKFSMKPAAVERFVYIIRGNVSFDLGNGTLKAGERDMIYLPRDTAYFSEWYNASEFMVVDLLLKDSDGQDIRFGDKANILFRDTHKVYDGLLSELAEKADAFGPFDWLERLSLCFKFLCLVARDTNREELGENYQKVKEGLVFLENNFASDCSIDELAAKCNLSPSAFRKAFFAVKGTSPIDYRNYIRIRRASELLRTGKQTVGEVADLVGIPDVKYFGKLFRRYTGLNPGELRKNK